MEEGKLLLIVGGVLVLAVLAAFATMRLGLPLLIGFLGRGMLLGSDGPGGIAFDDAHLARVVGVVGLVAILYEGGLATPWRSLRSVAVAAVSLGTIGVVVTAAITGVVAHELLDLSLSESFL